MDDVVVVVVVEELHIEGESSLYKPRHVQGVCHARSLGPVSLEASVIPGLVMSAKAPQKLSLRAGKLPTTRKDERLCNFGIKRDHDNEHEAHSS